METTKKTKKYYRDEINASYARACKVFEEALIKYCPKRTFIANGKKYVDQKCRMYISNGWNGGIEGFDILANRRPKMVLVDLYVQGYDTDSSDSVELKDFISNGRASVTFKETYLHGKPQLITGRYTAEQLYEAMKKFADTYLTASKKSA